MNKILEDMIIGKNSHEFLEAYKDKIIAIGSVETEIGFLDDSEKIDLSGFSHFKISKSGISRNLLQKNDVIKSGFCREDENFVYFEVRHLGNNRVSYKIFTNSREYVERSDNPKYKYARV